MARGKLLMLTRIERGIRLIHGVFRSCFDFSEYSEEIQRVSDGRELRRTKEITNLYYYDMQVKTRLSLVNEHLDNDVRFWSDKFLATC